MKIKTTIAAAVIAVPLLATPAVATTPPAPVPIPSFQVCPGDADCDGHKDEIGDAVSRDGECGKLGCGPEERSKCSSKHWVKHHPKKAKKMCSKKSWGRGTSVIVLPHTGSEDVAGLTIAGIGVIALGGIAYSIGRRRD